MDKKQTHVLIFPAGEINSVELHDALSSCVNIKVFGGSSVDRHGPYIFKNYIGGLPFIHDEQFFEKFNKVLKQHGIDIIFPTHDTIATFFADNQDRLRAKVIVADKKTSAICRDKQKTYDLFADTSFVPHIFSGDDNITSFPIFIKPKIGQGSVGTRVVGSSDELVAVDAEENVISEFLPGEEYTVDCLTDKNGKLAVISPRSRDRTLAGVSVAGQSKSVTKEIQHIADTINERLTFSGLWFFQIKKDAKGDFKLLEISTRCAGTMCLTRVLGANLPLLSVYVALGYDVAATMNPYHVKVDRTLINRYEIDYDYDTVYLDFDDTVIVDQRVHPYTLLFIYQCQSAGKKIYLITKHAEDISATLRRYKLDEQLFTRIIHLRPEEHKIEEINPKKAIFIDNAFQERKLVQEAFNIPVFDVDAIEVLLDWRT